MTLNYYINYKYKYFYLENKNFNFNKINVFIIFGRFQSSWMIQGVLYGFKGLHLTRTRSSPFTIFVLHQLVFELVSILIWWKTMTMVIMGCKSFRGWFKLTVRYWHVDSTRFTTCLSIWVWMPNKIAKTMGIIVPEIVLVVDLSIDAFLILMIFHALIAYHTNKTS